jgi:hypothetical protein
VNPLDDKLTQRIRTALCLAMALGAAFSDLGCVTAAGMAYLALGGTP